MKQIKTIVHKLYNETDFDEAVNKALAEGWTLIERKVLQPQAQPHSREHFVNSMLYAELEKHIITEAEKNCDNCAHCNLPPDREPCLSCSDDGDKWEPEA